MKKHWLSFYVENSVGVLAELSGLFAGKNYNLLSLSVGETEREDISRMTVCLLSDSATLRQVQKQVERCIDVLRVIDMEEQDILIRELMLIKLTGLHEDGKKAALQAARSHNARVTGCGTDCLILEAAGSQTENEALARALSCAGYSMELVRSGATAIELQP